MPEPGDAGGPAARWRPVGRDAQRRAQLPAAREPPGHRHCRSRHRRGAETRLRRRRTRSASRRCAGSGAAPAGDAPAADAPPAGGDAPPAGGDAPGEQEWGFESEDEGLGDLFGRIAGGIGSAYGRVTDALGGASGSRIIDLTDKSDKSHRKGKRDPKKVYALVLHQMACCFRPADPLKRFLSINSHFAIAADGRILQLHPITELLWSSNGFNAGSVAVEFAGNFPNTKGTWWQGDKFGRDRPTPAQLEAGRYLVRHLIRDDGAHPRPRPSPVERFARERSGSGGLVPRRPMGGRKARAQGWRAGIQTARRQSDPRRMAQLGTQRRQPRDASEDSATSRGRASLKGRCAPKSRSRPRSTTGERTVRASTPSTRAGRQLYVGKAQNLNDRLKTALTGAWTAWASIPRAYSVKLTPMPVAS